MKLSPFNFAKRIDFDVFKTSTYSQQVLNVGNEIQALIFGMTCLGSFPEFLLG
jgi:hypothetical protein